MTAAPEGALAGRVVVVTGGCKGVGRGIAVALADAGAAVVIACRCGGADAVAAIEAAGGRALGIVCDVTRRDDVTRAVATTVAELGGLHAMIHNATSERSSEPISLEDVGADVFHDHIAVALDGARWCALASLPHLRDAHGTFILLTSPAGFEGNGMIPLYSSVKAAQRGLLKALAREWGPLGVTVNGIAPLAMTPAMERAFASTPGFEGRVVGRVPAGRVGDPARDIGPVAVFLVGDGARYVTGQNLPVNGGSFTNF